jgi:hypothetical protein
MAVLASIHWEAITPTMCEVLPKQFFVTEARTLGKIWFEGQEGLE